jgi:hypothetical protein
LPLWWVALAPTRWRSSAGCVPRLLRGDVLDHRRTSKNLKNSKIQLKFMLCDIYWYFILFYHIIEIVFLFNYYRPPNFRLNYIFIFYGEFLVYFLKILKLFCTI